MCMCKVRACWSSSITPDKASARRCGEERPLDFVLLSLCFVLFLCLYKAVGGRSVSIVIMGIGESENENLYP